jgi:hypothetical protein
MKVKLEDFGQRGMHISLKCDSIKSLLIFKMLSYSNNQLFKCILCFNFNLLSDNLTSKFLADSVHRSESISTFKCRLKMHILVTACGAYSSEKQRDENLKIKRHEMR